MSSTADVVVIGGGFAGIVAARELSLRGVRTVVLEGRDRLGGRTWSREVAGHTVELGGAWVHWTQPHVFAEISRYGLELLQSPTPDVGTWLVNGDLRTGPKQQLTTRLESALKKFWGAEVGEVNQLHSLDWAMPVSSLDQLTVQDRLDTTDLTDEDKALLSGLFATMGCGPCSSTSLVAMLRWWLLGGATLDGVVAATGGYKIRGGTGVLVDAIVADGDFEVQLSTAVTRVEQMSQGIRVTTRTGDSYTAKVAVCTIPLNTMSAIDFSPALSGAKARAAREGQSSCGLKAVIRLAGVAEQVSAFAPDTHPFTDLETDWVDGAEQGMIAFGARADRLDLSDLDAVAAAVHTLLPQAEILEVLSHDWVGDEYSRGTWTVLRPTHATQIAADLQRSEGPLIIAGDATASLWNGFIDGAIESGLRAARQARSALDGNAAGPEVLCEGTPR